MAASRTGEHRVGDLIVLTSGEYSDFGITGIYRALKDFNDADFSRAYVGRPANQRKFDKSGAGAYDFPEWVKSSGYLEEIEYCEIHYGAYGRLSIESTTFSER